MTTAHRHAPATPALVIVTPGESGTPRDVGRCVRQLLAHVPRDVTVRVMAPRHYPLPPGLPARVRVRRVEDPDAVTAVAAEVAGDRAVVVLPARFAITSDAWLPAVLERLRSHPFVTGVHDAEGVRLFAFPPAVRSTDAPQVLWHELSGCELRDPSTASTGRGHQTLSAVLIVKDEEDDLPSSLSAVRPFVDEVVVYDTGSTDETREIARRHGAVVVEGYWDDDFGAARNRALDRATGQWVLVIDADEVVEGSASELRELLARTDADALVITQVNGSWATSTTGSEIRTTRLFRRDRAHYRGKLHEQVVPHRGTGALRHAHSDVIHLMHSGYQQATMTEKNKQERNVSIALAALERTPERSSERPALLVNYGRSLAGAGRVHEGVEAMRPVLSDPASPGDMLQAGHVAVPWLTLQDRTQEAEEWLAAVEAHGESPGQVGLWRAGILLRRGDVGAARVLVEGIIVDGGGRNLWSTPFDTDLAVQLAASIDLLLDQPGAAAGRMRDLLARRPEVVDLQVLFNALGAVGYDMGRLIHEAPEAFLERSLREMTALAPQIALPWFAAHCTIHPEDYRPVVAGCAVAARTDWLNALEWSTRAREAGLPSLSPLRDLAQQEERSPQERGLAWALLDEGFGDPDALTRLVGLLEDQDEETALAVLRAVQQHVPEVLARLGAPTAGSTTASPAPTSV